MAPSARAVLALVGATTASAATFWWRYPNQDAENEDLRQLPCAHSCTLDELETACGADAACVAFNTHGWLKKSIADQAPDSCDLYVKMDRPQPSPTPTPSPPPIYFWPMPTNVTWGSAPAYVDPALAVTINPPSQMLSEYADKLLFHIFQNAPAAPPPGGALKAVTVNVANPAAPLALGVDESYTLTVDATGVTLSAPTPYGAMMGLQTLSQAIRFDFDVGQYAVQAAPLAISDAPRFAWRGILIDTVRGVSGVGGLCADGRGLAHMPALAFDSWCAARI